MAYSRLSEEAGVGWYQDIASMAGWLTHHSAKMEKALEPQLPHDEYFIGDEKVMRDAPLTICRNARTKKSREGLDGNLETIHRYENADSGHQKFCLATCRTISTDTCYSRINKNQ